MQHKRILTAIVAVILIAGGVFGGFKLRDTFFSPSGNYQGTTNQLQEPEKSESISSARNTAVVQAAKKVSPAVVGITTKVYNRDMFNRKFSSAKASVPASSSIKPVISLPITTSSARLRRSSSPWLMDRARKAPSSAAMPERT